MSEDNVTMPDPLLAWMVTGRTVEDESFDYSFLFKCDHEIGGRCTRENNEIGKCCYEHDGACGKVEEGRTVEDVLDGYRRELATAWRYTPDDDLVDVEDEITARYADELRGLL